MSGLERQIDVLRAQFAAVGAGCGPGEPGPEMWKQLKTQAEEIAALQAELAAERAAAIQDGSTAADGYRAKTLAAALSRAREELVASRRTIAQLSAALLEAALHECPPPPLSPPVSDDHALYQAVIRSSSWRLTRPLRVLGRLLKGRTPRGGRLWGRSRAGPGHGAG